MTRHFQMCNTKIRIIYYYEFKLSNNASRATSNINHAFGKGTANSRTVQRWFKSFQSGKESLENDVKSRPPTKIDNENLRA